MNSKRFLKLAKVGGICLVIIFVVACGQKIQKTIAPVKPEPLEGKWRRVTILPLADYSGPSSLYEAWRRNVLVQEAIEDEFFRLGFMPAPKEDVYDLLVTLGVVKEVEELKPPTLGGASEVILRELTGPWSESIKEHLREALKQNIEVAYEESRTKRSKYLVPPEERFTPLDPQALEEIGRTFHSRFIVRGRIIEFKKGFEETFDPFRIGFLPFFFNTGQRVVWGVAPPEAYDFVPDQKVRKGLAWTTELAEKMAIGASSAYAIANAASASLWEKILWADIGAGLGVFSHPSGRLPEVTVQVRLFVQDALTGDVIWTNRAEVRVSPETVFARKDMDLLRDKAIKEACRSLVANFSAFFQEQLPKIRPIYKEITWEDKGLKIRDITDEVEKAKTYARKAEKAAERSEAAAEKSERIFEKMLRK